MLCFYQSTNIFGSICTNRCTKRQKCNIVRSSILIESTDILTSEIVSEEPNGLFLTTFIPYCSTPEAYLNGVLNDYCKN